MAVQGKTRPRSLHRAVAGVLALTSLATASAADFAYEFSAGAGQSDNITRRSTDPIDETIAAAGLRFSLDQRSSRVEADLVGNFAYNDYLDDTYDSEFLGNFAGTASFVLVEDRVRWMASDNFGQVLTDPFVPATPENSENLNYFSTGPDVVLGFGSQMELHAGARYSLSSYESHDFDSDSVLAQLGLVRLLSKSSSLGLNARWQEATYDDQALNADYDEAEAFLSFEATGARTYLNIDAGYNEISHEIDSRSDSGPLLRLDASRRVSARSRATLSAGHEFRGSGAAFAATQGGGDMTLDPVLGRQTAQPFMHDHASLGWRLRHNRTEYGLTGSWNSQEYTDAPLFDQSLISFGGSVSHDFTPQLNVHVEVMSTDADFDQPGGDYHDDTAGLSLRWRMARRLSMTFTYAYTSRDSDQLTGDYDENRLWLSFGYSFNEPRTALQQPEVGMDAQAGEN